MSNLLRLARTLRGPNPLQSLRNQQNARSRMTNYFCPSNSPYPKNLGPSRARFYSSGRYTEDQIKANISVIYALMGINGAVFGYAIYIKAQAQQGHPQAFVNFMRNWTCNLSDVKRGAWWQLITSAFTHVDLMHILGNMFTTYYLGTFLCYAPIITPQRILMIALGSGVAGNVLYLYQRSLVTRGEREDRQRGLGFSGALMGITSVAACLAPTAKVYIYGIVPLPLWATVAGYAIYDGYFLNDQGSRIGHAGHLGGLAFGIAYYLLRLRGLRI